MKFEILTKEQTALLKRIGQNATIAKHFYLTGGTPLAAFYLQHRYSEDLDFFSEYEIDTLALSVFFKKIKKDLSISKIDFEQSYNRNLFFLTLKSSVIKTEFTYFPFSRIGEGKTQFSIEIDSLIDIAVNKLFTIYQRTKARDYIDLYFICREHQYAISDLVKKARVKFDTHIDPIQLGAQFIKALEAMDYPRMIQPLDHNNWRQFFIDEAKKLKPEIIE